MVYSIDGLYDKEVRNLKSVGKYILEVIELKNKKRKLYRA